MDRKTANLLYNLNKVIFEDSTTDFSNDVDNQTAVALQNQMKDDGTYIPRGGVGSGGPGTDGDNGYSVPSSFAQDPRHPVGASPVQMSPAESAQMAFSGDPRHPAGAKPVQLSPAESAQMAFSGDPRHPAGARPVMGDPGMNQTAIPSGGVGSGGLGTDGGNGQAVPSSFAQDSRHPVGAKPVMGVEPGMNQSNQSGGVSGWFNGLQPWQKALVGAGGGALVAGVPLAMAAAYNARKKKFAQQQMMPGRY